MRPTNDAGNPQITAYQLLSLLAGLNVEGNVIVNGDITGDNIWMNGVGVMGFVKVLTTESLGSIGGQGIYQQQYNANATTARGYPVPYAGYLEVINKSVDGNLFVMQRYTAYRRSYTYATTDRGYPVPYAGYLEVLNVNGNFIMQRYTAYSKSYTNAQPEVFTRFYYYVTGWTAWTPKPDADLSLTHAANSYVNATDFTRMQAYRRNNLNILAGNLMLTNSLPSNATFVTIGTINDWSALTDVSVVAPAQNGSGAILVNISDAGVVQIYNGSGAAASGFHRFSLTVPSASS